MGLAAGAAAVLALRGAWALMGSGAPLASRGDRPASVRILERHSLRNRVRVRVVERDPGAPTAVLLADATPVLDASLVKSKERRRRARKRREEMRLRLEQQEAAARQVDAAAAAGEVPRADELPAEATAPETGATADTGERPATPAGNVDAGREPRGPGRVDPPANPPTKPGTSAPGAAPEIARPAASPGTVTVPP
jgi:hypothetical protein